MSIDIKLEGTKEISNALVEIFSPVTELLGTLGDQVRIYRQLSLMRALKHAQEIVTKEQLTVVEPPIKFLVPFMEDCSLEAPEDNLLVDMWAKLFVSAASNFKSEHNLFIRILREMTYSEAKLLEYVISQETHQHYVDSWHLEDVEGEWSDPFVFIKIRDSISKFGTELNDTFPFENLEVEFRKQAEQPGCVVYFFDIEKGVRNEYPLEGVHTNSRGPIDDDFDSISIAMLKSLGLIGEYKSSELWFGSYVFDVRSYFLTELGAHFVASCTTKPVHSRTD
jgi:hypothetical protein